MLVTLPGAFVGMLIAGASPVQAGAVQLLVLIGLLLVQAVAVAVTVELISAGLLPIGDAPLPGVVAVGGSANRSSVAIPASVARKQRWVQSPPAARVGRELRKPK